MFAALVFALETYKTQLRATTTNLAREVLNLNENTK